MATRKSNPASSKTSSAARDSYTTIPVEDRLRSIEKRLRQSDRNRMWQTSLLRRAAISIFVYVTAAMLLVMMLIPGWYVCALVPVAGYWLAQLGLWLVRDIWETLPTARKK